MYDNIKVLTLTAHLRFVILEIKRFFYLYKSDLQKNGIRSRVHTNALLVRHFVVLRIFFLLNLKEV